MLLLALVVSAAAMGSPEQDLSAIRQRGVLRVVVRVDPAGYGLVASFKPGTPPGLDRELVEGFAALHRLKVDYVPAGDDRIPVLLAGRGDVIIGIIDTESRRKQVAFTVEVTPQRSVVVTHRPHPSINSVEELRRAARVGVQRDSSAAQTALAAGVARESLDDTYPSLPAMFEALRQQRVPVVVASVLNTLVERRNDADLELGPFVGRAESASWAVAPGAVELKQALDEYLTNVRRTATWSRLVVKYYGDMALEILQKSRVP
jgi:ABC-type amino acid transport substrate-binding protein